MHDRFLVDEPKIPVHKVIVISGKCIKEDFFYRNLYKGYADNTQDKTRRNNKFYKKMALVYNPSAALTFVIIYWAIGLKNAQFY